MCEEPEVGKNLQEWKEACLFGEQGTRMVASNETESTSCRSSGPTGKFLFSFFCFCFCFTQCNRKPIKSFKGESITI